MCSNSPAGILSRIVLLVLATAMIPFSALIFALPASAQSLLKIDLPKDTPVTFLSSDLGESRATPRGNAYQVDLHASLTLRNSSSKRIRGLTLAVRAHDVTPGGTGVVWKPSLDVAPGDSFPVQLNLSVLRPGAPGDNGPSVEVQLDGVLFEDLSFYGPDKLQSKRSLTVWELEAQRDRKYFKALLETGGREALQKAMLGSLSSQADSYQPGVQMQRGRATNVDPANEVQFAFLHVPDAPVEAAGGTARVTANEAHSPQFNVSNLSKRPVQYLEIGWIVKDQTGREFLAASLPADLTLAPGQSGKVALDTALRFPERTSIQNMRGFVSTVEFSDGTYWIPSRASLESPEFRRVVAPSPEEQRLSQICTKRGLSALIDELKKF
jgi:hypothetical protein